MPLNKNSLIPPHDALIMYVDMNSYFASCEQQVQPRLRGKAIGVCPYSGPNAVVIAASTEAKKYGIKTGMALSECRRLCTDFEIVPARPVLYRKVHIQIMDILHFYCKDVIPKSIDEAIVNLTSYRYIYKDVIALANNIKHDIQQKIGEYITCSIGISGNAFLAKLATEVQKPNGLVHITPQNLNGYLAGMKLTDLPGIARANEKRLNHAGIYTPLDMKNAPESLLRKAFGGVVGNYWYCRLHFKEVDLHMTSYKRMSAMRSLSSKTRASEQALLSMLISLCTRLEQRLVKQDVFCRNISFYASYYDGTHWKADIKLNQCLQDAMDMLHQIQLRISEHQKLSTKNIMRRDMSGMGVIVGDFVQAKHLQYTLFDDKLQKDMLRKTVYTIKDRFGKNMVRKASETMEAGQMKDAIGFGSVKDLYEGLDEVFKHNSFLLQDDPEMR